MGLYDMNSRMTYMYSEANKGQIISLGKFSVRLISGLDFYRVTHRQTFLGGVTCKPFQHDLTAHVPISL